MSPSEPSARETAALRIAIAAAVLGLVGLAATQFTPWPATPSLLPIWASFVLYLPATLIDRRRRARRGDESTS